MREDEQDILEMLMRHELVIKQLYEVFAALFASHQDFWQRLAGDEQRHADRLDKLRSDSAIDTRLIGNAGIKIQAIKSSITYVESQIARAQDGQLALLQALSIARDLESALVEKHFSKLSDLASREIKSTLMDLAAETERHRKALVDAIDSEKRRSS